MTTVKVATNRGCQGPRFMPLLLVNTNRETLPTAVLPIGMLRVAEAAEEEGIPVEVLDLTLTRKPERALRKRLERSAPSMVGLSVRNIDNADFRRPKWYLPDAKALVDLLREMRPEVPIVAGGAGISAAPRACRDLLGVDTVVAGPGEAAVPALYTTAMEHGRQALPPVVEGVEPKTFRPAPDYGRWINLDGYLRRAAPLGVQSRRGCPFGCVYCNYAAVEGRMRYELGPIDRVVQALADGVRRTGVRDVEFVDSTFNSPPQYAIQLCERIASMDLGLSLQASGVTPRHGSREMLEAMRAAGFSAITCSPDAAAQGTIDAYGKGFDRDELARMAQHATEMELPVLWSLLFGGPGETQDTVRETLRFIEEAIPRTHRVMLTSRMRVYPNTKLAALVQAEGGPPPGLDPSAPGAFYLSPALAPEWLDEQLAIARRRLPHLMHMDEGQAPVVAWVQRFDAIRGKSRPTWMAKPAGRFIH